MQSNSTIQPWNGSKCMHHIIVEFIISWESKDYNPKPFWCHWTWTTNNEAWAWKENYSNLWCWIQVVSSKCDATRPSRNPEHRRRRQRCIVSQFSHNNFCFNSYTNPWNRNVIFRSHLSDIPLQSTRFVRVFSSFSVFGQVKNRIVAPNSRHCPSGGYKLPLGSTGLRLLNTERPFFTQKDKEKKRFEGMSVYGQRIISSIFVCGQQMKLIFFRFAHSSRAYWKTRWSHTHTEHSRDDEITMHNAQCRRKVGIEMAGDATLEHAARKS